MRWHFSDTGKTGSTGPLIPPDKGESEDCPSLLFGEFPDHGMRRVMVGDSEFIRAMFKRPIRVPGSQMAKRGAEPWKRENPCQARAVVRAPPVSHPAAELRRMNQHLGPGKGNRKQQAKQPQSWQGRGSLTLLLPAGSGRPLTTQSITSSRVPRNRAKLATDHRLIWISLTKLKTKA